MDGPSLLAVVAGLDPALRGRLCDFAVRFLDDREAEVTLRFALALGGRLRELRDPWAVGFEPVAGEGEPRRWKTLTARIPLEPSIHQQLQELERSQIAGGLRPARMRGGSDYSHTWPSRPWGSPHHGTWRFLTHAGTTAERRAWLRGLITQQSPATDRGTVPNGTFPAGNPSGR